MLIMKESSPMDACLLHSVDTDHVAREMTISQRSSFFYLDV